FFWLLWGKLNAPGGASLKIRSDSLDALRPIRRYFYVDGNIERGAAFLTGQNIVLNFSNFTGKEHLLRMLVDRIEKPGWRPAGCCWIYICQAAAGAPVSSSQAWRITRASSSITGLSHRMRPAQSLSRRARSRPCKSRSESFSSRWFFSPFGPYSIPER